MQGCSQMNDDIAAQTRVAKRIIDERHTIIERVKIARAR
jgi:hypothetical protein